MNKEDDYYIPSETERKRAMLMYFLMWIMGTLSKKILSSYELFHLKQAMWWWNIFFILLVVLVMFFLIPIVWYITVLIFFIMLLLWCFFLKQARDWTYFVGSGRGSKIFFPFFYWVWAWIISVFELKFDIKNDE